MEIIKEKFIDKVFGDEVEYVIIKNEEEKILIFQYFNKINIIKIDTVKDLIENLIECKLLSEYLQDTLDEQDDYIEELENQADIYNEETNYMNVNSFSQKSLKN